MLGGDGVGRRNSRLAEVEDGLSRGEVLDVAVLEEGGVGGVGGGEGGIAGSLILVLYRVFQTVRSEQSCLLCLDMTVDLLRPAAGEILRLLEVEVIVL